MRNSFFFDGSVEIKPPGVTGVDARHRREVSPAVHAASKNFEVREIAEIADDVHAIRKSAYGIIANSGLLFAKKSADATDHCGRSG
jgi:hypothetical protein